MAVPRTLAWDLQMGSDGWGVMPGAPPNWGAPHLPADDGQLDGITDGRQLPGGKILGGEEGVN